MNSEKTLSIVIIAKDTKDLLKDLLDSIREDGSLEPFLNDIVVVDNGSKDGTDAMVRQDFPAIKVLHNEENKGFAASANAGFRSVAGDFVLFLNSDTLLMEGEVLKMLQYMRETSDVGICGPQLIYPDMRPQRSSAAIPSILPEIVPAAILEVIFSRKYPGKPKAGKDTPLPGGRGEAVMAPREVDSLIGAAIMVRRSAMEKAGGFDERFFFFLEETDLCMKIRNAGFRVLCMPGAKVVHLQGKTVRKNWVKGRMEYNISMYKFIGKHHSRAYYRCFQSVRVLKVAAFLVLATVLPFLLLGSRTRRTYTYYRSLIKWHWDGCPDDAGLRVRPPG